MKVILIREIVYITFKYLSDRASKIQIHLALHTLELSKNDLKKKA